MSKVKDIEDIKSWHDSVSYCDGDLKKASELWKTIKADRGEAAGESLSAKLEKEGKVGPPTLDPKVEFRKILLAAGVKQPRELITQIYFDGDIDDYKRLWRTLKDTKIPEATRRAILMAQFKRPWEEFNLSNDEKEKEKKEGEKTEKEIEDEELGRLRKMQRRLDMEDEKEMIRERLKARRAEYKRQISGEGQERRPYEKMRRVVTPILDKDGNVKTSKDGQPLYKTIYEPVGDDGGGSGVPLWAYPLMQKGSGSDTKMMELMMQNQIETMKIISSQNKGEDFKELIQAQQREMASLKDTLINETLKKQIQDIKNRQIDPLESYVRIEQLLRDKGIGREGVNVESEKFKAQRDMMNSQMGLVQQQLSNLSRKTDFAIKEGADIIRGGGSILQKPRGQVVEESYDESKAKTALENLDKKETRKIPKRKSKVNS